MEGMVRALLIAALLILAAPPARALELVMFEAPGCAYCAQWHAEVGDAYPKTAEGKAAPLRAVQLRSPPEDLKFIKGVVFTPTFVLVHEGREVGRIQGYPGEDFFWGLLNELLDKHAAKAPS